MAIAILCPHCQLQLANEAAFAGQVVACPRCNGQFQMPPVHTDRVSYGLPQTVEHASGLIGCPDCGAAVSSRAAACPRCGAPISRTDSTVAIYYEGGFFLVDFEIDVIVDEEIVGRGTFVDGIDVVVHLPLGQHSLELATMTMRETWPFNTHRSGNYRIDIVYSEFRGWFTAGTIRQLG